IFADSSVPALAVTRFVGAMLRTLFCANESETGSSEQTTSFASGLFAIEEVLNFRLILVFADEPHVHLGDAARAVDQKRRGERIDSAVERRKLLGADHHAIVDFLGLDVGLDALPAVIVEGHAQNGEVAILILLLKI